MHMSNLFSLYKYVSMDCGDARLEALPPRAILQSLLAYLLLDMRCASA